ncbi:glycoprotein precursor [Sabia virus]|uniref:Pre-glycoprotein polyprotein GP complex n=3 Tax=Sabia mammarenavirus (isolate Human/Brasil/SPH114202/1990) TaxID=3052299 RepID=GLYC_SABVB|nr:glycoprotein precursor [Sabia virus]Q90037.1 RecName: Full=Pre-glycoprotein polyprotein GP complex; Short=Pre-GP-C; Contains: RecName: Full=Stable signal peptide; Short=SSP; Contains: RecName: Full=Glycoprotein G1; Short=GP1; Contains: RecName: Full=Glycoprotein G2; Short=GP2 [Mammarenavirus brazilense]AAC55091.1 glycoprotein precursor [Sabia virus]AFA53089.1 glycoprotein precurser [Sabia virus]
MGQLFSFFEEVPNIIHEAINIALIAVSLIAALKGMINLWKSGLFQLIFFLTLAGRSCSFRIGRSTELQNITFDMLKVFEDHPTSCMVNHSTYYVHENKNATWCLEVSVTDVTLLMAEHDRQVLNNLSNCVHPAVEHRSRMVGLLEWIFRALKYDFNHDPTPLCQKQTSTVNETRVQINITEGFGSHGFEDTILQRLGVLFGSRIAFSNIQDLGKKRFLLIRNSTWKNQCEMNHVNSMHLMLANAGRSSGSRRPLGIFSWTITDAVGNDMPGGYCLERWMLVTSDLKCFGNTALAKCNLDHDSEFCDMLKLFEFNKKAIETLNDNTKNKVNLLTHSINALISDNLLMKNRLKELLNTPYCNYTKFWYVNHTASGEHSLPRCWLVRNNSYLNESEFRNDWIIESDHLLSEMLNKEYIDRQGKTPLTLVDICFWSTLFFTTTLFLHLVGFPTHRHIRGEPCPLPHRLNSRGGCRCGKYPELKKPITWHKNH